MLCMDTLSGYLKQGRKPVYNVGVFPGKFLPPHRGHLCSILSASTKCKTLYVVISDRKDYCEKVCEENSIRPMPMVLRAKWLSQELQGLDNIKVLMLDEGGIPAYPGGTKEWSKLLIKIMPEPFDVIFGGDAVYQKTYMGNFPSVAYDLIDRAETRFSMSATKIRSNPIKYWDYIMGSARAHFAKRVLVTGTESCGKTTLVKILGKIYHTSWTEEAGRSYSARHLGGNEDVFSPDDFEEIAREQIKLDNHALRTANKIVFFDTDAVVTQFYCGMYLRKTNPKIEEYVDHSKFDLVLYLTPDVPWIADGLRWKADPEERSSLDSLLHSMYMSRGFANKLHVISGTYNERLEQALELSDRLLQ